MLRFQRELKTGISLTERTLFISLRMISSN